MSAPTMSTFVPPTTLEDAVKMIGGPANALKAVIIQLKYAHKLKEDKALLEWARTPEAKAAFAAQKKVAK